MIDQRILIAGAGIGGLTTALALHQRGADVVVLERAESLEPVGAGLTLWPNALQPLDRLGLSPALQRRGRAIEEGALRMWNGDLLKRTNPQRLAERFGRLPLAIHRGALHQTLRDTLPRDVLYAGKAVVRYEDDGQRVAVQCEDSSSFEGDLLVGADGLCSTVRQQMRPDLVLRYAGYAAWRGVVPCSAAPQQRESTELWGRGERFGIVPLGDDQLYWFATANYPAGRSVPAADHRADLMGRFGDWMSPVAALIDATPDEQLLYHDLYDIEPFRGWSAGRVTLLGDAAHPTTPNMGQGACMAIESAWLLARLLDEETTVEAALSRYERERAPRTAAVTRQSWQLGQVGQLSHGLACRFRNAVLQLLPSDVMERQLVGVVGKVV
ncbi:MAG: FAD-dependent monooxygenase [Anaerolineales bacterium]|nr:FAD-dependent monooxygenase [Anaerolineales bacterium]